MAFFSEELAGDYYLRDYELRAGSEFNDNFLHKGRNIYEVVRVTEQVPLFLADHLGRLQHSSERSGYPVNPDLDRITDSLHMLIEAEGAEKGNIKLVFHHGENIEKTFFSAWFIPHTYPALKKYRKGVRTVTLLEDRPEPDIKNWRPDFRRRIKNLKTLRNVYEVVLINENGFVTEGSQSNLFIVQGNRIITAPEKEVLAGITRKYILEICHQENIEVQEKLFGFDEMISADAVFLTGTSPKVLPVSRIDQIRFEPGNKIVRKLADLYDNLIDDYIKHHSYES